jgi:hypothetical protein
VDLVLVALEVLSRWNQIIVELPLCHVMFSGECDSTCKPIIEIAPFTEMIGYLPIPLKELKPFWTCTSWPWVLLQNPSKKVGVKIVKFPPRGRMYFDTAGALAVRLPVTTWEIPGTAATLLTMASASEVELPAAACAASRSMSPTGTVA